MALWRCSGKAAVSTGLQEGVFIDDAWGGGREDWKDFPRLSFPDFPGKTFPERLLRIVAIPNSLYPTANSDFGRRMGGVSRCRVNTR